MLINLADQGELDLRLAGGAPEQFEEFVALGNSMLTQLEQGSFSFDGNEWQLEGQAATYDIKAGLLSQISDANLGDGAWKVDITSPDKLIEPYLFSAEKSLDGSLSATGFAPNQKLIESWAEKYGWRAQIERGAGAPEGFALRANLGLSALELLDAGRLSLVGGQWAIIGRAPSDDKLAEILDILAAENNAFLVDIQIVPPIENLALQIEKTADGQFNWSGYVADERFWDQTQKLPISTTDVLPERQAFHDMIALGVDTLALLNEGEIIHAGGKWSISGEAPDRAVAAAVKLILETGPLGPWYTTIAQPIVPVAEAEAPKETPDLTVEENLPAIEAGDEAADNVTDGGEETTDAPAAEGADTSDSTIAVTEEPSVNTDVRTENTPTDSEAPETPEQMPSSDAAGDGSAVDNATEPSDPAQELVQPSEEANESQADTTSVEEPINGTSMAAEEVVEEKSSDDVLDETAVETEIETTQAPDASDSAAPDSAVNDKAAETTQEQDETANKPLVEIQSAPAPIFELQITKRVESGVAIDGNVPDAAARYALELSAGTDAQLDVAEAEGAPERFLANALTVTQALSQAEAGDAALIGGEWTIDADVNSFEARDQLAMILAAVPNARVTINTPPAYKLCNANLEQLVANQAILFQSGSARITDGSRTVLTNIADVLSNCPNAVVEVEGHTDADGDDLINLSLSVQRAETVVSELVEMGVRADRLYALGFGETLPIADNDTRQGKAQNRRIVFTVRPPLE